MSKEEFVSMVNGLESRLNPSLKSTPLLKAAKSSLEQTKHTNEMQNTATESSAKNKDTPPGQQSHIQSLVGMLTEQGMCASTDDELLDDGNQKTKKKHLPISKSVPTTPETEQGGLKLADLVDRSGKDKGTNTKLHSSLSRNTGSFRSNFPFMDGRRFMGKRCESDSDNSDFEYFLPPPKNTSTAAGFEQGPEVPPRTVSVKLEKSVAASLGPSSSRKVSKGHEEVYTPMDSAVPAVPHKEETKKKVLSPGTKRALFGKSISSDSFYYESISSRDDSRYEILPEIEAMRSTSEPEICTDSTEEDGSAVVNFSLGRRREGARYSEPSLPTLIQESEQVESQHEYDTDEGCTYLDPKDLESQPIQQRRVSVNPLGEEACDSTYLTLQEVQLDESRLHEQRFNQHIDSQSSVDSYFNQHSLPGSKTNLTLNIISGIDKWRPESSCASGYSTDSSSNWDRDGEALDRPVSRQSVKVLPSVPADGECDEDEVGSSLDFNMTIRKSTLRRRKTSHSCLGDFGDGEIYAEIEELDNEAGASDDKEDDVDGDDYIASDKYVSFIKNREMSGRSNPSGSPSAESPLLTATLASDQVTQDAAYETLYMGGPVANTNVQYNPPTLPPRPLKTGRHISVPLVSGCMDKGNEKVRVFMELT